MITGLMITVLRVQPVVVTLAMYFALQGVNLLLAPNPASLGEEAAGSTISPGTIGPIPGALFTIGIPLLIWYGLTLRPVPTAAVRGRLQRRDGFLERRQRDCRARSRATPSAGCSPASAGWR